MGQIAGFRFDPGTLGRPDVMQLALAMWSDIGFDRPILARLRRDGLARDGVRLRGPCPCRNDRQDGGSIRVRVENGGPAGVRLDLWRLHFSRGLRAGHLAG